MNPTTTVVFDEEIWVIEFYQDLGIFCNYIQAGLLQIYIMGCH